MPSTGSCWSGRSRSWGRPRGTAQLVLGFLAVFLATLNVVGGFVVTDRMLEMFKSKPRERAPAQSGDAEEPGEPT